MISRCLEKSFETISQVAFRHKISRQAVHNAIREDRLDALIVGNIFLITKGAIIKKRIKSAPKERYPLYILNNIQNKTGGL